MTTPTAHLNNVLATPAGAYFAFVKHEWERMYLWIELNNLGYLFYPHSSEYGCTREEALIQWIRFATIQSTSIPEEALDSIQEQVAQVAIQLGTWQVRLRLQQEALGATMVHSQLVPFFPVLSYQRLARFLTRAMTHRLKKPLEGNALAIYETIDDMADW